MNSIYKHLSGLFGLIGVMAFSAMINAEEVEPEAVESDAVLDTIVVEGVRERLIQQGMLKDSIQKTEVVTSETIEKMQADTLAEAIEKSPGVRVNNECSMCGFKRVQLNGLKGEQTTILVDGIPTYTVVAGFYGIDATASAGVERIEIARGAGASLIAPEAIGGSINIVTQTATRNGVEVDVAGGEEGYKKASLVATGVANEDTNATRVTFIAQYDARDQFDGDDNGVSENPELENEYLTLKLSQDIGTSDNLLVRISDATSELFGGPTITGIDGTLLTYALDPSESAQLFVNGDVRNQYIGKPWETAEWVKTDRQEFSLSWLHEFSSDFNMTLTGSYNDHEQDSFYEGFEYVADDEMVYGDIRFNYAANSDHLLTFGLDAKEEELRSETNSTSPDYVSDSFDYETMGIYLQDTWNVSESLEIAMALRVDDVVVDFVDPSKPGTEIDETVIAPRVDARYLHNDNYTSRISAGRGYRAPLSFFETDHGILDAGVGFILDIDDLEESQSATYALSYEDSKLSATWSLAYTEVDNLSALTETMGGVPVLTQLEDTASVTATDIALTYQLTYDLALGGILETMSYDDNFKESFAVAPIETRAILSLDWDINDWEFVTIATWVASRTLSDYAVPENPTFDQAGTLPMSDKAESYWTVDFRLAKDVTEQFQVYLGANNLFGYNQAEDQQTPLFYEDMAYDVAYISGPLRGREAYLGVKYTY